MSEQFKAMLVKEESDGSFSREITQRNFSDLPKHEVLIKVKFTSLNYKDALSYSGHKGITRNYPHTPGIDAAGIIEKSASSQFKEGDEVIVTGFDLGMNTWGAFGEYICVPAEWVYPLPKGLSLKEAMFFGTAGFTAAICIDKLELNGLSPDKGEVLVTGSTGAVGSLAVAMLSHLGYEVVAATGKLTEEAYLKSLGASEIMDRNILSEVNNKPFVKPRWAGVIDTVSGDIMVNAIKATKPNGSVACCGMITATDFTSSIFPFILRGINLLGVDSAEYPANDRLRIWEKIAGSLNFTNKENILIDTDLDHLEDYLKKMLEGKVRGRVIPKID